MRLSFPVFIITGKAAVNNCKKLEQNYRYSKIFQIYFTNEFSFESC